MNIKTEVLTKLKSCIEDSAKYIPATVDSIILFGSYARGEQTIYSDLDIAIVRNTGVSRRSNEELNIEDMLQCAFENLLEVNVFYTQTVKLEVAESEWDTNYLIKKEGKLLWSSTAILH